MNDDQFWGKVNKNGPMPPPEKRCEGLCWIWIGTKNKGGYGVYHNSKYIKGKERFPAHRISYEITSKTVIPEGLSVCHKCDNTSCVNPDHLFLGTAKDNIQDCIKKGRRKPNPPIGERHSLSKLTERDVKKAIILHDKGLSAKDIGVILCVSSSAISNVIMGRTWTHITGKKRVRGFSGPKIREGHPGAVLTELMVEQIKLDRSRGLSYKKIADKLHVGVSTVRDVIKGYTWK